MSALHDYAPGFGGGEQDGLMDLQKAMQAGQITGSETMNQSLTQEPLKVESLEHTLKNLEMRTTDIKLFNAIPKMSAYNTVEEFLQLSSYGEQRGGFYNEGELSDVEDSTYIRRSELVKYMQVTGEVTIQAQMVRSYVDAMTQETKNKMMWIMRLANKSLVHADASIVPQEFNSIYKQHASIGAGSEFLYSSMEDYYNDTVIVDLRGESLKQGHIEEGAVRVDANYGNVSSLAAPTSVISALSQDYFKDQRILQNGSGVTGTFGSVPKVISTTLGDVSLMADKFMKQDPSKLASSPASSDKAPGAPTNLAVTLEGSNLSKFRANEVGNVFYAVAAVNRYGESNLAVFATAVTLAEGQSVVVKFDKGTGSQFATGYSIYRTKVTKATTADGLEFYPIFKVSEFERGQAASGSTGIKDHGYFLPDTEQAFVTEMSDEVLSFKQLAPLSKLDLAVQSMSRRFICFMFGTPQVYAPKKIVRFINVGKKLN